MKIDVQCADCGKVLEDVPLDPDCADGEVLCGRCAAIEVGVIDAD